jgi:outer membrane protein OmpA-like peptidoglycan-associated protein
MRSVILLAVLGTVSAAHAAELEPAIEVGANAGVFVFDALDLPNTSYIVVPRVGVWFNDTLGLELDVGIGTGKSDGEGAKYTALTPQINLIGSPVPRTYEKSVSVAPGDADPDGDGLTKKVVQTPVLPIVTIGAGAMHKMITGPGELGRNAPHSRTEALITVGTGLIIPIWGPLQARTDVRMLTTLAREDERYISPFIDFSWTAGLQATFGLAKDTDKDGLSDNVDQCITDPEDVDGWEDGNGCPDPDNDGDTVLDGTDRCPNDAEDADAYADEDGCPDPDNDSDGVPDTEDTCPLKAGPPATNGCPDDDGDGIANKDDRCPQKAGPVEYRGCPDTDGDGLIDKEDECPAEPGPLASFGCPDKDGDLVPDMRDKCIDKPANKGIDPKKSDGCPARVFVTKDSIQILETVYFDTGKSTIKPVSFSLLNEVATVLKAYPQIKKVQVEGHTDDRGNDDSNLKLSKDRAKSVLDYLVQKGGVEASRLVSEGFGETQPVADNATEAGRAQNRRVVFKIVEQEQVVEEVEVKD